MVPRKVFPSASNLVTSLRQLGLSIAIIFGNLGTYAEYNFNTEGAAVKNDGFVSECKKSYCIARSS
jgi:hypothetical protein